MVRKVFKYIVSIKIMVEERTTIFLKKSTRDILLKKKLEYAAKLGENVSWDEFLLEMCKAFLPKEEKNED